MLALPARGYVTRMRASFCLGRIAGIRIGVHWSVLVIFALIAWGLAASRFPAAYPHYSTGAYVLAGLLTAVAFFASLLAHELSHALVARRNGLRVEDITLWLFGGVARLSGEARDPGADLRIAGIGPLVSLLLGAAFLMMAKLLAASGHDLVQAGFAWLGTINILLAVFNAIPAAPLDGGRLLRSIIWWRTGDRLKAIRRSSRAGEAFGWVLVTLGLITFFARADFSGLWFAPIGWFVIGAATAESQQATVRNQLSQLAIRDVMTPHPITASASMTVADLLSSDLIRHRHSTFPLTENAESRSAWSPSTRSGTSCHKTGPPPDYKTSPAPWIRWRRPARKNRRQTCYPDSASAPKDAPLSSPTAYWSASSHHPTSTAPYVG